MTTKFFNLIQPIDNHLIEWPVAEFATHVQLRGTDFLNALKEQIPQINNYIQKDDNEQIIDLLTLGLMCNNYHSYLSTDALFYAPLFNWFKRKNKGLIDGDGLIERLAQSALLKKRDKSIDLIERFEYLYGWLKATNEFDFELQRIKPWQFLVEQLPQTTQDLFWAQIKGLTDWFIVSSKGFIPHNYELFKFNQTVTAHLEQPEHSIYKVAEYQLHQVAIELLNGNSMVKETANQEVLTGSEQLNRILVSEFSY